MKDSKQRTSGSTTTTTTDMSKNKRIFLKLAAREILKKLNSGSSYQDLLLVRHRLREYYFSRLNINVPSPNFHNLGMAQREGAEEMELEPHECLLAEKEAADDHYDEENGFSENGEAIMTRQGGTAAKSNIAAHESEDKKETTNPESDDANAGYRSGWESVEFEVDEPYKEILSPSSSSSFRLQFMPFFKIRKMTEDSVQIHTAAQKDVSLTSTLFDVPKEEKLDIVFGHQYIITETKVPHTIQVEMQPGYDLNDLENKLRTWAGFSM
ncbi:hypothetical protein MKX01_028073 [Papaver californicum]|nr:hypothetical protein MKX01_028073 [Papaver californicum]